MRTEIKHWEAVILSGKDYYEPRTKEEEAAFDIAEYFIQKNRQHLKLKGKLKMHTYEIHFIYNGRAFVDCVTTTNALKARELILGRYENSKITSVREVQH